MKSAVLKSYEWLHSTLLAGVRHLPVSSKAFGPPKGLIPDMREWVVDYKAGHPDSECWYRKIHDAVSIQYGPPRSLEEMAPVFLEDQNTRQPEVFIASIPRPRLLSRSGIIIAPDDRVFEESCAWKDYFFTRDAEYNTLRRKLKPTILPGSYITLISRHANSYYHWFTECLSRLCIAESLPSVPVLLNYGLRDWQLESLALMGIASERQLQLPDGCYEVDQLYFPSFPGYATFTTEWTFSWADWTLIKLREQLCGTQTIKTDKRIYVSREGAGHRRVLNEEPLMRALEREGVLVIETSRLSIQEKINLFADAALVVGAHGAGLTHSLFAPSGSSLVEVLDPAKVISTYYRMAAALGQNYWYLFGENQAMKSRTPQSHSPIDPLWPFEAGADSVTGSRKGFDDLVIPIDLLLRTIETATSSSSLPGQPQVVK